MSSKAAERATVLIIEDEAEICRFVSRVLELEGYRVLEAGDADQGLQLAKANDALSLVLLDLRLPGRDGWHVLKEFEASPGLSEIPIIVFSASADASQRERALRLGAAQYLVKPLDAAGLRQAVDAGLRPEKVISGGICKSISPTS